MIWQQWTDEGTSLASRDGLALHHAHLGNIGRVHADNGAGAGSRECAGAALCCGCAPGCAGTADHGRLSHRA